MNRGEDEGFLARWSRRKGAAGGDPDGSAANRPTEAVMPDGKPSSEAKPGVDAREPAKHEPLDLSTLPPIESIGADTDLTPFFRPGVPSALKHAALRRVWVTDPAIRDFVGLQEYDWDFNSGDIPGFGTIGPDVDVRAMAERLLGGGRHVGLAAEGEPPVAGQAQSEVQPEQMSASSVSSEQQSVARMTTDMGRSETEQQMLQQQSELVQRDENVALQDQQSNNKDRNVDSAGEPQVSKRARRHGSALPS